MINQIILEKNVETTMRDGEILRSDIYRPTKQGQYPVLLTRLPYGKDNPFYSHRYLDTNRLVANGYVVIVQDVRGLYNSDGSFFPFQNEAKDGYDTIEWAAHLPYANGSVGMFGLSYYGFTQLLAASEQPAHLKAIFPAMTLNDLKNNMIYHDKVPTSASFKTWVLISMVPNLLTRKYKDKTTLNKKMEIWQAAVDSLSKTYHEPLTDSWPILTELGVAEDFLDVYKLADDDDFWKQVSIIDHYQKIAYPAIHLGGWYDNLLKSTIENYQMMQEKTNTLQKLIIGPWTHGDFNSIAGERDFGIKASESFLNGKEDLTDLHLRWFDYWLKNKDTGIATEAPIQIFIMGKNEWRNEYEWPLARTAYTPYYLHKNGKLTRKREQIAAKTTYLHDPNHPVPTVGGQTLYHGVNTSGPTKQDLTEKRKDVLIFETDELENKLEVTGPIHAHLWVSSEASTADFTAKLIDVNPDGTTYNLTDGISRVKITESQIDTNDAGESIAKVNIDLWATSNLFLAGHKIRIEIASSNHPRFDVNWQGINQTKQTIYMSEEYPSHLVLPIIE